MMLAIEKFRKKYLLNQKAQGIVEYALILAFVVVVAAAITNGGGLRDRVQGVFESVTNTLPERNAGQNNGNQQQGSGGN